MLDTLIYCHIRATLSGKQTVSHSFLSLTLSHIFKRSCLSRCSHSQISYLTFILVIVNKQVSLEWIPLWSQLYKKNRTESRVKALMSGWSDFCEYCISADRTMTLPKNYGLEETVHCPALDLNVQDVTTKTKNYCYCEPWNDFIISLYHLEMFTTL